MGGKHSLAKEWNIPEQILEPCLRKVEKKMNLSREEILPFLMVDWGKRRFSEMKCKTRWVPVRLIGWGSYKIVYQVCQKNKCDRVLTAMNEQEFEYHQRAAKLQIAPHIYDHFTCNQIVRKVEEVRRHNIGVIMEKMDGQISDFYPFDKHLYLLDGMLDIAERSLRGKINHNDWKISNYLWKYQAKRVVPYLSDFGEAYEYPSHDLRPGISRMVGSIISTMIFLSRYGTKYWYSEEDSSREKRIDDIISVESQYPDLVERVILSCQYLIEEAKRRFHILSMNDEDFALEKVQSFFNRHLPQLTTQKKSNVIRL